MSDRLDNIPSILSLREALNLLGGDWKEAILDAMIRGKLQWVYGYFGPKHPKDLDWERTPIAREDFKKWISKLPVFGGRFLHAPPMLTRDGVIERIGSLRAAAFDQEDLPTNYVSYYGERLSDNVFETTDVVAWWDRVNPELPAPSPAVVALVAPKRKPRKPISSAEKKIVLTRLKSGDSLARIHRETGHPKDELRRIKQRNEIPDATPGPAPRALTGLATQAAKGSKGSASLAACLVRA